ncbi:MAG: ribose 5-phosphate isomerase B [Anaerolineae bacterium]|nr:ribose 5-phosphate isomerase B [Anaerolineae bacterium]
MRIAIGADHAGYELKELLKKYIHELGHDIADLGTDSLDPVDYPDFAQVVGETVARGQADRGVLICGSGIGASIAANKVPGVRAGVCHDCYSAHQGVEHDDMNILVLGSRAVGVELAKDLVKAYLAANFTHEERHIRRLGKVKAIEASYSKLPS